MTFTVPSVIFLRTHWTEREACRFDNVLACEGANSYISQPNAGIAQLVERNLAKVDVAGSNPVSRSVPLAGQRASGNRAGSSS